MGRRRRRRPAWDDERDPLGGEAGDPVHWYTLTNATLWMAIAVLAIAGLFVLGTQRRAVVPGRAQSVAELLYGFIH